MPKPIKYTKEQLDFIKDNCAFPRKKLTEVVNIKFGTNFSLDHIKSLCTRNKWNTGRTGYFEKGNIPLNKGTKGLTGANITSFKKGRISPNTKPLGYERICSKDGYILVKVAQPNIYKFKHRLIWERANGPIPNGMALSFRNLDRTDCRLENLVLMTKAEMARYCQSFHKSATPQTNESCLLMAKIKSKTGQLKNA